MTSEPVALTFPDDDKPDSMRLMRITPMMARRWYTMMIPNRPVRPKVVDAYAADMAAGRWVINGDPIRFNQDGKLIDGQHRLLACMQANAVFFSYVVRGLDEKQVMHSIDVGPVRTQSDYLLFQGYKHATVVASAAKALDLIRREQPKKSKSFQARAMEPLGSRRVLEEYVEKNPILIEAAELAVSLVKISVGLFPPSLLAGIYAAIGTEIDKDFAREFVEKLATGEKLGREDPVYKLRQRLIKESRDPARKLSRKAKVILALRTWNYHITGNSPSKFFLKATDDGSLQLPSICGPDDNPNVRSVARRKSETNRKNRKKASDKDK